MLEPAYIQTAIFTLGIISIIIAGYQDKKNRIAPAIYLAPTLIGFGINPILGLVGLVGTIIAIFFYKDSWNKKIGLADLLLYFTLLLAIFNPIILILTMAILFGYILELALIKKTLDNAPLIWIFSKWLILVATLALIITLWV